VSVLLKREDEPLYVSTQDGCCLVRGCQLFPTKMRLTTANGFILPYCDAHDLEARELFGPEGRD
jgi:hypothetical protein